MSFNKEFKNGIVVLGAGNVATHLSMALKKLDYRIRCVFSNTIQSAELLSLKVGATHTTELNQIPYDADLYIVAVKDELIERIIEGISLKHGAIVHTAGSVSIDIFKDKFENYGVFYPLQTFSKTRAIDFFNIPICIESSNEIIESKLSLLAGSLSNNVYQINSEERRVLHLAAVFACNFVNHMYSMAAELLDQTDRSFELLKPLIYETAQKAIDLDPRKVQTGPAIRNDSNIIDKHIKLLQGNSEIKEMYKFVSESIYTFNQKTDS